jgi:hypothetical protein
MADLTFTVTDANVKTEMTKVWEMANKGLKAGDVIVTLGREGTSDVQGKCYHAMIRDISKQADLGGNKYDAETWKALLVSQFATEMHLMGTPLRRGNRWIPSLCGTHMVCIRPSVKEFGKKSGSAFIEFLLAKGAEYEVKFTDATMADYENYAEAQK